MVGGGSFNTGWRAVQIRLICTVASESLKSFDVVQEDLP